MLESRSHPVPWDWLIGIWSVVAQHTAQVLAIVPTVAVFRAASSRFAAFRVAVARVAVL